MYNNDLIERISDKNINIEEYINKVLKNEILRKDVVELLLTNKKIMVYYHCFYIISEASYRRPQLFYNYWEEFVTLLSHKNSYHRDIGITILANLSEVDIDDKWEEIFDEYIIHLNDEKFMTSQCLVKNLKKVIINKKGLENVIINKLLKIDELCVYTDKQKELLKSDIINVFDVIFKSTDRRNEIIEFVRFEINSKSPKTRRVAKAFITKHNL